MGKLNSFYYYNSRRPPAGMRGSCSSTEPRRRPGVPCGCCPRGSLASVHSLLPPPAPESVLGQVPGGLPYPVVSPHYPPVSPQAASGSVGGPGPLDPGFPEHLTTCPMFSAHSLSWCHSPDITDEQVWAQAHAAAVHQGAGAWQGRAQTQQWDARPTLGGVTCTPASPCLLVGRSGPAAPGESASPTRDPGAAD